MKTWLDGDRRAVRQAAIGLATWWMSVGSVPLWAAIATPAERPAQHRPVTQDRAMPRMTTFAASSRPAASTPPTPPSPRTPPGTTAPGTGTAGQCGPDAGPGRGLKEADLDGDGKISRTEFMQFHALRFERMPKDRNGLVSVEDAMREGGLMAPGGHMGPGGVMRPGGVMDPGGARRPASPLPPESSPRTPGGPATPDPGASSRPSGSSSPDGEPDRGPPPRPDDDAASSSSFPSSTPSSSAPQEAKPGR